MEKITYKLNGKEFNLERDNIQDVVLFVMLNGKELTIPNIGVQDFYNKFPLNESIVDKLDDVITYVNCKEPGDYYGTAFKVITLLIPYIENLCYTKTILTLMNKVLDNYDKEMTLKNTIFESVKEDVKEFEDDIESEKFEDLLNRVIASLLISPYYFLDFDYNFFKDFIKGSTSSLIPIVYGK